MVALGAHLAFPSILPLASPPCVFVFDNNRATAQPLAFLSGPSFAVEIMKAHPTAVVVASRFLYHAVAVQRWLSSLSFRVYTTQVLVLSAASRLHFLDPRPQKKVKVKVYQ